MSGRARWKTCIGQGMWKGHRAFLPSPRMPLSQHFHVFSNLEALQTLSFWNFMKALWLRHGWLNHWSLAIFSTSSPSFPGGWDWKFQTSNHRVRSPGNHPPSLGAFQKHLIKVAKETFVVLVTRKFQRF